MKRLPTAASAALAGLAASALVLTAAAQARDLELPARIGLAESTELAKELMLYQVGVCCHTNDFAEEPPAAVTELPEPVGIDRRFFVVELAGSSMVISLEDPPRRPDGKPPPDGAVLVRFDLDLDGDLAEERLIWCHGERNCGPFRAEIPHGDTTVPYHLSIRHFGPPERRSVWYYRAGALVGEVDGRAIAVIDDDTDGTYMDTEDVVVIDFDGDGSLDGGRNGAERRLIGHPIPWGDEYLQVAGVDPVAGALTLRHAQERETSHRVADARSGHPIRGARVAFHPGSFSAESDAYGLAVLRRPAGTPHFVTVSAGGFWSTVYGPGQQAGETAGDTLALEPGPCIPDAMLWCGRETLEVSSMSRSMIDLESGVVGPRVGPSPGPMDLGWYVPPEGKKLSTHGDARLAVLGEVDFDSIGPERLAELSYDLERVFADETCEGHTAGDGEVRVRKGTVVGLRTAEGHLAKARIDSCGWYLDLRWIVYRPAGAGASARVGTPAPGLPPERGAFGGDTLYAEP